jgi:ABC-type multidrug transport system ATPase subunit
LNVLSDRINLNSSHTVSGKPLINNKIPCTSHVFGKIGAYVMQDDVLFTYFSPRQALHFAARLKLSIPFDKQDRKVEQLLQELGLEEVADQFIGNLARKCLSGGERKRTSIGVELITNPSIIFLDEPTSGLDSFTAYRICKILKK